MAKDLPRFAVVGHPNQGKSSIVATLACDDTVAVAPLSGTTVDSRHFPMRLDGQPLYDLIDTPGFQCPREVRSWLQKQIQMRRLSGLDAVKALLKEEAGRWPDEARLLQPLTEGAAILYVVDGSVPYADATHEDELHILALTEQPRMALINRISTQTDYTSDWRSSLKKHFPVVREFNAVTATFETRIEILRALAVLNDGWGPQLNLAADAMTQDRQQRRQRAARAVAQLIADLLALSISQEVSAHVLKGQAEYDNVVATLNEHLMGQVRRREQQARAEVERIYQHERLSRKEQDLPQQTDLFSEESWRLYGLSRLQLTLLGTVVGAAAGAAGDLLAGGASLGLVAASGGLLGALGGAFTPIRWLARPTQSRGARGAVILTLGPISDNSFPFVVLNRAYQHHAAVVRRTHADRSVLSVAEPVPDLPKMALLKFGRLFRSVRTTRPVPTELMAAVEAAITERFSAS